MACVKRSGLEKRHDQAGARFDSIRKRLHERIGICPKEEFLMLNDDLERASKVLDAARAALDQHIRQHCCLTHETAGDAAENT